MTQDKKNGIASLLKTGVRVVNFGLERFYEDLKAQDTPVVQIDWTPRTAKKELLAKLKDLKKSQSPNW